MKKFIVLFFTVLMIIPVIVSCSSISRNNGNDNIISGSAGSDGKNTDTGNSSNTSSNTAAIPDDLTFDGWEFIMTGPWPSGETVFIQEEDSDDVVESAVYKRNSIIEDRFDIIITGLELGQTDSLADAFSAYALSEDDVIDVLGVGYYQSGASMILSDYIIPWNNVDYIDITKEYWDSQACDSLAVLNNYYYLTGDINIGKWKVTQAVFFNKTVAADQIDVGNLYQTVLDGEWTYDLYLKYITDYSHDNGDGVQDEKDYYGLVTTMNVNMAQLYYAGETCAVLTDSGVDYSNVTSNKMVDIFDKAISLLNNNTFCYVDRTTDYATLDSIFFADRALFYSMDLGRCTEWRNQSSDFGILPLPKYNQEQKEYYTYSDQWGLMLALPCTASDTARTGAILEVMAQLSNEHCKPAFYEKTLQNKIVRDDESKKMLEILISNYVWDPGLIYIGNLEILPMATCVHTKLQVTTWYAAYESALNAQVNALIDHVRTSINA